MTKLASHRHRPPGNLLRLPTIETNDVDPVIALRTLDGFQWKRHSLSTYPSDPAPSSHDSRAQLNRRDPERSRARRVLPKKAVHPLKTRDQRDLKGSILR